MSIESLKLNVRVARMPIYVLVRPIDPDRVWKRLEALDKPIAPPCQLPALALALWRRH